MVKQRSRGTVLLSVAALFAAGPGEALEVKGSLEVNAIYTDNLGLNAEGEEFEDRILNLMPEVTITHLSKRLDVDIEFAYGLYYYDDYPDSSNGFPDGKAKLDFKVVPDFFTLETRAAIASTLTNSQAPLWFSNVPVVGNRTDLTDLEVAPRITAEVLGYDVGVRYGLGHLDYAENAIEDVDYQNIDTRITDSDRSRGLHFGATHRYRSYEYESPPEAKFQEAYLRVEYLLGNTANSGLYVDYGRESDFRKTDSASLDDTYWAVGFQHEIAGFEITAGGGDRSYGSFFGGQIQRRFGEDGRILVRYSEDPTTQADIFGQRTRDDDLGIPEIPGGLDDPRENTRFILKRADATLAGSLGRTTFELIGYYERREDVVLITGDDQETLGDETQYGTTFSVAYAVGPKTDLKLGVDWLDRELVTGQEDQAWRSVVEMSYRLGGKTSLRGWVARQEQTNDEDSTRDVTVNEIGFGIRRDFF